MLTETEKLLRAKLYMLKLANGINPIDDSDINSDSALNNERLKKCFAYVSEVLAVNAEESMKKSSEPKLRKTDKKPFSISSEDIKKVEISEEPCTITAFVSAINSAAEDENMKKLQAPVINDWLVEKGYLKNYSRDDGKTSRNTTELSSEIGIFSQWTEGAKGFYYRILYSPKAQHFILEHINEILG